MSRYTASYTLNRFLNLSVPELRSFFLFGTKSLTFVSQTAEPQYIPSGFRILPNPGLHAQANPCRIVVHWVIDSTPFCFFLLIVLSHLHDPSHLAGGKVNTGTPRAEAVPAKAHAVKTVVDHGRLLQWPGAFALTKAGHYSYATRPCQELWMCQTKPTNTTAANSDWMGTELI